MKRAGVLVITAHPDDECMIAGGVLAACAARDVQTGVVCLTRGEHGPIADPDLASRETLAEVRQRELHEACTELGVGFVKCYRRRDGELMGANWPAIAGQLAGVITRWRPRAVITFGVDGIYYHPDHIAVHYLTREAFEALDATGAPRPWLYEAVWPAEDSLELVRRMGGRGLATDLWGLRADVFGVYDLSDVTAIDVRPFIAQKLRALRSHRTQLAADNLFAALPDDLAEQFLGVERFRRVFPRRARDDWLSRAVDGARASL